jgi:hypothetical protein
MDATLVLAIIGAATGTASSAAQVLDTTRDRARLNLGASTHSSIHGPPTVTVTVSNIGTRPTTVRDLGLFYSVLEFEAQPASGGDVHKGKGEVGCSIAKGVFLEPGQSKDFDATPQVLGMNLHADQPLRLYARDMRGRRIWSQAVPILRLMVGPQTTTDIEALPAEERWRFEPPSDPLLPGRAEPGWKLWKKRDLRQPKVWRPPWEQ